MIPNREEIAWAGGLFEGEGSIHIRRDLRPTRSGQPVLRLSIGMCDPGPLERFQRAVGGFGAMFGPYSKPKHPTWRPVYLWQTEKFEHVQAVIAMLWPWLDTRRREQYRNALRTAMPMVGEA